MSWKTEPALECVVLPECLLDGVKAFALRKAFDRDDAAPIDARGHHHARLRNATIDLDRTGAAIAAITPAVAASEAQSTAKDLQEDLAIFDPDLGPNAVDLEAYHAPGRPSRQSIFLMSRLH
jgi:hypothetical protein